MKKIKLPAWAPYVSDIHFEKGRLKVVYNGGEMECKPDDLLSLMIYGDAPPLDPGVLDKLARHRVPLIIHRRNLQSTLWIHGGLKPDVRDVLTAQIKAREDARVAKYIARTILERKLENQAWLVPWFREIRPAAALTLAKLRALEAGHARLYWRFYFEKLGLGNQSRRNASPVQRALDAGSKFLYGIILRWIHYHHLSPFHGFLHEPADYPSLVYDCMEPYRGYLDQAVFDAYLAEGEEKLLERSIVLLKERLKAEIYSPTTRQVMRRQELFHGVVLGLRAYLLKEMPRFVIPVEGVKNGGRPLKVTYKMYGRSAGITPVFITLPQSGMNRRN